MLVYYKNTYLYTKILYSYNLSQEAPLFKSEALIPHVRIRMIQFLNKYNSAIRKIKESHSRSGRDKTLKLKLSAGHGFWTFFRNTFILKFEPMYLPEMRVEMT